MGTTLPSNGVLLPRLCAAPEKVSNSSCPKALHASSFSSGRPHISRAAGSSFSSSRRPGCSSWSLTRLQGLRSWNDAEGHSATWLRSRGRSGLTCRADLEQVDGPPASSAGEKSASAVTNATDEKWRSTVTRVIPAPIDKVWSILADFNGLHTHFPQVFRSCVNVDGEPNKVGALRSMKVPSANGFVIKAKERLLALDNENHTQSYAMEDSNVGWTGYAAHVEVTSIENDQTHVDWSYEVDPVSNKTKEEYLPGQDGLFIAMLQIVKETLTP